MTVPLLQLTRVTTSFGAVRALKGVTFDLQAGAVHALAGENGAGSASARVFIMDEPTASLTANEQRLLFALVRELCAGGAGVVYISHRLEEVFALADRVTVLRDGETVGTRRVRSGPGNEAVTEKSE